MANPSGPAPFGWRQGLRYGALGAPPAFAALPLHVLLPSHYAAQSRIVSWREGLSLAGVLTASVLPSLAGMPVMVASGVALLALGWWALSTAPFRLAPPRGLPPTGRHAVDERPWALPWRVPAFRALMAVFLLNGVASAVPATLVIAIGLAAPLLLTGCAGPTPADYASQAPKLDLKQYFNGKLLAHGIVTDRSGQVVQRFTVQMTGTWQGDTGTLDEQFTYSDGRQDTRVWTLTRGADGRYTGRAADVVGQAQGQAAGKPLHWRYTLRVPVDGRDREVEFDDWMFLVDEHAGARALALDATDTHATRAAAQALLRRHGRIDLVMYCAGHYRAMTVMNFDLTDALRHQQINLVGALNLLDAVLPPLLRQAAAGAPAHLSLLASVAGYRGLPNALAYGPTKAALINLAEVLYLDLHARGAGVSLVNPGFVATPLTAQNRFHMPALISPEAAAEAIVAGWEMGEFEIHFPKRFTRLLKAMRQLPDRLYFGAVRRVVRA